jgi:hypothetical protein
VANADFASDIGRRGGKTRSGAGNSEINTMATSTIAGDEIEFSKWLGGTSVIERMGEAPADQAFCDELAQAKLLPTWFSNIVSRLVPSCPRLAHYLDGLIRTQQSSIAVASMGTSLLNPRR